MILPLAKKLRLSAVHIFMLDELLRHEVVSDYDLQKAVYGERKMSEAAVRVQVSKLRRKLQVLPVAIHNSRIEGYWIPAEHKQFLTEYAGAA